MDIMDEKAEKAEIVEDVPKFSLSVTLNQAKGLVSQKGAVNVFKTSCLWDLIALEILVETMATQSASAKP